MTSRAPLSFAVLRYLEASANSASRDAAAAKKIIKVIRQLAKSQAGDTMAAAQLAKSLMSLPARFLSIVDIRLIGRWMKEGKTPSSLISGQLGRSFLTQLLESASTDGRSHAKAIELLKVITRIAWESKPGLSKRTERIPKTVAEEFWLDQLFRRHGRRIGAELGTEGVKIIERALRTTAYCEPRRLSYIWRPAIEDHEQNHGILEPVDIFILALRQSCVGLSEGRPEEAKKLIRKYLNDSMPIVGRIGLFVVQTQFPLLRDVFVSSWKERLVDWLQDPSFRHELVGIVRKNRDLLSIAERKTFQNAVFSLGAEIGNVSERAATQLPWLRVMSEAGWDGELSSKLLKLTDKTGQAGDHHDDFPAYTESMVGPGPSPLPPEKIVELDPNDLLARINSFEEKGTWGAPTEGGLAENLKMAVRAHPDHFAKHLDIFLDTKLRYQHAVLNGFVEAQRTSPLLPWANIFRFVEKLFSNSAIWVKEEKPKFMGLTVTFGWLISDIATMLEYGMKTIPIGELPRAKAILVEIIHRWTPDADENADDPLHEAINSPRGKAFLALFAYISRINSDARGNEDNRGNDVWGSIQSILDEQVRNGISENSDFFAVAGWNLHFIFAIARDWLQTSIGYLFPMAREKEAVFRATVSGFCQISNLYLDMYDLLRDKGIISHALSVDLVKRSLRDRLVQIIALAYLNGHELIEAPHSNLRAIFDKKNDQDLIEIISFLGSIKDPKPGQAERIRDFWHYVLEQEETAKDNAKILGRLPLLINYANMLDQGLFDLMNRSAGYIFSEHTAWHVLRRLEELIVDQQSAELGANLCQLMVSESDGPIFDLDNLLSILRKAKRYAGANAVRITVASLIDKGYGEARSILND